MGSQHVCFADELPPKKQQLQHKASNGSLNSNGTSSNTSNHSNNSNTSVAGKKYATDLESNGLSPSSSLSVSPTPHYERHLGLSSSEASSTLDIAEQQQQQQQQQQQLQQQQPYKRKSITRESFSRLQRRSTSSLRRAFESLSLTSRSLSCSGPSPPPAPPTRDNAAGMPLKSALKSASNGELHKHRPSTAAAACCSSAAKSSSNAGAAAAKSKSKPPPQRILRQPVSYTYLKGMSGLPTQRVPRSSVCCQYARR